MRNIRKIVDLLIKQGMTPKHIIDNVSDLNYEDFNILSRIECIDYAKKTQNRLEWIILYYGE